MVDFSEREWKEIRYRIDNLGNKTVFEAYPELDKYEEFAAIKKRKDGDEVMKWIIVNYTHSLRTVLNPHDITKRKKEAAEIAGLSGKKAEKILNGEDEEVIHAVARYLHNQNSLKFAHMAVLEELLYNLHVNILSPIEGDMGSDKKLKASETAIKCSDGAEQVMQNLEKYSEMLFGKDSDDPVVNTSAIKEYSRGSNEATLQRIKKKKDEG